MAVYAGEKPEFLAAALQSLRDQTELPDEILLIKDGPLGAKLEEIVSDFTLKIDIRSIQLPVNLGLANALNVGLAEALHPWIMRFDSDDICCPERVARQRLLIASGEYDIFGSQIKEFDEVPALAKRARLVPTEHKEILKFGKKRNPFNHMTVCFQKDLAQRCGGYPNHRFMEDYSLWIKLLSTGARSTNDSEVLVMARVGNGMIQRRGGLRYVWSEIKLQYLMVRSRYKSFLEAVWDGTIRSIIFLMPVGIRSGIYSKFLRRSA